ncbi:MAG: hypothetical protein ACYSR0_00170 [Planctomycetota bacterium]|jgi:hypothetical protein
MCDNNDEKYHLLQKILGWGALAFFAFAGWFIHPTTTHYQYFDTTKGKVCELDLISISKDLEHATPQAKNRGKAVLAFGLTGITFWCGIVLFIANWKYKPSSEKFLKRWMVNAFAIAMTLLFIIVVIDVVDPFGGIGDK